MKQAGNAIVVLLIWLSVIGVSFVGWVLNIIKVFDAGFDPLTGEVVLRIIGIFVAPLGAIMGFI